MMLRLTATLKLCKDSVRDVASSAQADKHSELTSYFAPGEILQI